MSPHFTPAALTFLRGLKRHNERPWFEERRPLFERELKAPMLALVEALNHAMQDFAPDYIRPAPKCVIRIYRDTRFSKDKHPYKTHMAAWWSRHGMEKTSGSGFYLQIAADEILFAAGVYMPAPEQTLALRRFLLDHHAEYTKLITGRKLTALFTPIDGMPLTRAPKGFPADHPATPLIRQRQWGIHATLPAEAALQPTFLAEILRHFKPATPLVDLLNTPLKQAPAKPLF